MVTETDADRRAVPIATLFRWTLRDAAIGLATAVVSFVLLPLPEAAFATVLGAIALSIAVVDLDKLVIPDLANIAIFLLGLILVATESRFDAPFAAVADAIFRAAVTAAAMYVLRAIYRYRTGIEGLGLGDVKLAGAAGPWLQWQTLPFAIAIAAIAALFTIAVRAVVSRQPLNWRQELPFGAFLAPAIWMAFVIERVWLQAG